LGEEVDASLKDVRDEDEVKEEKNDRADGIETKTTGGRTE